MVTKRSPVGIVHEILQLEGKHKTQIMYVAALTDPQSMRYLDTLTERGLLAKETDDRGSYIYAPTSAGRDLSDHLGAVMDYLGLGDAA